MEIRHCWRHGEAEFALYGRAAPQWRCKHCVAEAVTRRHRKVRQILVEQAGGKCVICGYDRCIVSLHFHHVDPKSKSFNMTMATGKSEAAYLAEARKCVLVCANCHGEIEAGLIESPPAPAMAAGSTVVVDGARDGLPSTEAASQLSLNLGDVDGRDAVSVLGSRVGRTPMESPRPDQEGFGEASLGEAQSSDPPPDPEMLEDVPDDGESEQGEGGEESYGGDQDAEPAASPEQVDEDAERDQAEG